MAITVLIERHLKARHDAEVLDLLRQLRIGALRQRGYGRGETLIDEGDATRWLVVATWASAEAWRAWQSTAERQALEAKLDAHLQGPPKVTVFREVWD